MVLGTNLMDFWKFVYNYPIPKQWSTNYVNHQPSTDVNYLGNVDAKQFSSFILHLSTQVWKNNFWIEGNITLLKTRNMPVFQF